MPKQIDSLIATLVVLTSCYSCSNKGPNISEDGNAAAIGGERCERLSGKWLVFKPGPVEVRADCEKGSCGEYLGPIELSCSSQKLSGRALMGIGRSQEVWTAIRARESEKQVELVFNDEGCETTYALSDSTNDHIFGDVSSNGCKLGDKEFRLHREIFLKRPVDR